MRSDDRRPVSDSGAARPESGPRPEWTPEVWREERVGPVRRGARQEGKATKTRFEPDQSPAARRLRKLPDPVADELRRAVGPARAPRLAERLAEATRSYQRDRLQEARQMLTRLADEAPGSGAVQELFGLTLYRMGRWEEALRHLRRFHELTGSYDQHPVMADCERALRRYPAVEEVWEELREASPSAEVITEGRIVVAGARADRGDLPGALSLLDGAARRISHPREHHLRLWYALGDLYEKAGDMPAARDAFKRVLRYDPAFHDAAERVAALS